MHYKGADTLLGCRRLCSPRRSDRGTSGREPEPKWEGGQDGRVHAKMRAAALAARLQIRRSWGPRVTQLARETPQSQEGQPRLPALAGLG